MKHAAVRYQKIKQANANHIPCIAGRTNDQRDQYVKAVAHLGCHVHSITGGSVDSDDPGPLQLATMLRIKGLEFDHVCLVDCGAEKIPSSPQTGKTRNAACATLRPSGRRTRLLVRSQKPLTNA